MRSLSFQVSESVFTLFGIFTSNKTTRTSPLTAYRSILSSRLAEHSVRKEVETTKHGSLKCDTSKSRPALGKKARAINTQSYLISVVCREM